MAETVFFHGEKDNSQRALKKNLKTENGQS